MWDTKSCRDLFISRGVSYLFFCLTILWVGPLHDRDVHVNDLELVRPRYLQGRLQDVEELGEALVVDVLGAVGVELLPDLVEEVVVLVGDALLHVLRCLRVVLQDHSNVHVHDDEETAKEEENQKFDLKRQSLT